MKRITAVMLAILYLASATYGSAQQQCIRANPTVTIQQFNQSGFSGGQLVYTVTVTNNDSKNCPASSFLVMATFPESGFRHVPDCLRFFLAPGESSSRNVIIIAPPNSCSGPKVFRETATREPDIGFSGFADAIFTVISLAADCTDVENATSNTIKKADGQLRAQVTPALGTAVAAAQIPFATAAKAAGLSIQPDKLVYQTDPNAIIATAPVIGTENIDQLELSRGKVIGGILLCSFQDVFTTPSGLKVNNGFYTIRAFAEPDDVSPRLQLIDDSGDIAADFLDDVDLQANGTNGGKKIKFKCKVKIKRPCGKQPQCTEINCTIEGTIPIN